MPRIILSPCTALSCAISYYPHLRAPIPQACSILSKTNCSSSLQISNTRTTRSPSQG